MKAWTWTRGGYPGALQQSTLPSDTGPLKSSEIRVGTKAASINPVDVQLMSYPLISHLPAFLVPPQKGVGEDFSGVVEEAGSNSGFKIGDEVLGITPFLPGGTLQETTQIDTKVSAVVRKPTGWSWDQAAALPLVWLTARTTIARAESHVKSGKIVILGGSSSCGTYAVYLAKQRGWTVKASCSGRNADFVRSMGADDIIDYTTTNVPEQVKAFAPDAIIDFVGGTECLGISKAYVTVVGDKTDRLSPGGRYIYLWNPQMLLRAVVGKIGLGQSYTCINLEFSTSFLKELLDLPKDKIVIDSVFEFDQVKEAFDKLNTGRVRGKLVINVAM
ncbi:Reticulon-4-interacting protein 1, mitochondrial [Daldinia childiae]|uniref:Reticulon-4-interacting protein 1, mitochondrial n=1 Tax=Daldinia childiae TaxID=326645 RepID=UPI0014460DCB|nr:Reticulon-4-interacting protein 1, mitochondrial [Daldinia childiae]KAF3063537.1 Reticulon-4-interacting protein 1, mitochondrial [Daldinia childiae]